MVEESNAASATLAGEAKIWHR